MIVSYNTLPDIKAASQALKQTLLIIEHTDAPQAHGALIKRLESHFPFIHFPILFYENKNKDILYAHPGAESQLEYELLIKKWVSKRD